SAPVLAAIANQTVNEGVSLSVSLSASDPDMPANTLTYSLVSGPSGAAVNPSSGVFSWTPGEQDGSSTQIVTVKVTDNGVPALSDSKSFNITVNEVNSPPVLAAITDQSVNEGVTLNVSLSASDPDIPAQVLTYSIVTGPAVA